MNTAIILISGKQGSGKTTLQKALEKRLIERDQRVRTMNFADVIYQMHDRVLAVLDANWPYPTQRDLKKDGPLLQLLGTEWGRKTISDSLWIDVMKQRVRMAHKNLQADDHVIIGDCRFANEFEAFPQALRVRLVADEEIRKIRCSMWRQNTTHPSEIGLDEHETNDQFDMTLDTEFLPVNGCVDLIMAQIIKGDWAEKRETRKGLIDLGRGMT